MNVTPFHGWLIVWFLGAAACTGSDSESPADAGPGEPACVAGGECRSLRTECTDSFGSSCACVERPRFMYYACVPSAEAGAGGGGGEGGAPGVSGGSTVDPTSGTRLCTSEAPTATGTPGVELTVDASQREGVWDRYYERGVAADHANTVLSTAWDRNIQGALKKGHDLAGFEYARFHGILNGDIGVYGESKGAPVYDWTRFDQVYDAVVAAGMRPIVEIGFTPPPLASDPDATLHWYNGIPANISKPADWGKWRRFMAAIVQHLEARYGVEEVRDHWFFEVWNEASWMYSEGEGGYPELYEHTVLGLLAGDPEVKVGGPATSAASSLGQIPNLVSYAEFKDLKLDFVTWHRYGNDGDQTQPANANGMLAYFEQLSGVIERTGFTGLAINDEWGPSYDPISLRDSEVAASFVAKTVHLIGTSPNYPPPYMFGYWTISDLYEEINTGAGRAFKPGNYGLLVKGDARYEASFDLEKPAFNAFRLLHMLGDMRLSTTGGTVEDGVNAVATVSDDGSAVQVLVYDHVNGGRGDSSSSEVVSLTVNGLPFSTERVAVKHYMIDRGRSNAYQPWVAMDRPPEPTEEQWSELAVAGALCYYEAGAALDDTSSWSTTYRQNVYGVSLFVLTPQ